MGNIVVCVHKIGRCNWKCPATYSGPVLNQTCTEVKNGITNEEFIDSDKYPIITKNYPIPGKNDGL